MRTLPRVTPTPEQLPLIQDARPGVVLIRGAAGSGKTTTALLRLRQLAGFWLRRRERDNLESPVRILVITFNRTLRGYIAELAEQQIIGRANLELQIFTFAKWAMTVLGNVSGLEESDQTTELNRLCATIDLPTPFLLAEIEYILGRFPPNRLGEYVACTRHGRGALPRVDRHLRQRILDSVIAPYITWKQQHNKLDWNDLAVRLVVTPDPVGYDVIIADEVQDLSANQIRALMHYANEPSSTTFVLDAAQRIYPRGFTWTEAGVTVSPADSHRLGRNYRNTQEICQFALPVLNGLEIGDDGTFPDFTSCPLSGTVPVVLKGLYSRQVDHVLNYMTNHVDLSTESVAFLKPKGGHWFDYLKAQLNARSYSHVTITRQSEWPDGDENIALSTMNSAKGLEFDHIFILGLSDEVTIGQSEPEDSELENLRRLFAMAITRARKTVTVGYKPGEASYLISFLDPSTYDEIDL